MNLEERWNNFSEELGVSDNGLRDHYFELLNDNYTSPERFYHDFVHVADCLREMDQNVREGTANLQELEMAIWFHDAIYNIFEKDNEEKSAILALDASSQMGLGDQFSGKVYDLIIATKHTDVPQDHDSKLIIDIDLAILGQEKEKFDEYEKNIWLEYAPLTEKVSEKVRCETRSRILQSFLDRESVYFTDAFRERYEAPARENLQRSIDALEKRI
jgi:predicted metal-dependent HD superfamily phosphohydrolase